VIKQGDYLAALAHRFGFDPDTVWKHDKNTELCRTRPNPNILLPTDVLYIPDQVEEPVMHRLALGTTNTFVSEAPCVSITIRFLDEALASQDYTVEELPHLTGLATDDGIASFSIPVTLPSFTIAFPDSGARFTFFVGHVDPIDTLTGVAQRLQNLGYLGPQANDRDLDVSAIRAGLRLFKASQEGSSSDSTSSPDGGDSSQDGRQPENTSSDSGNDDAGDEPTDDADGTSLGDAGLSDDGKLDDATSKQLLAAHGS
jgi:hypothetical protein